MERDSVQLVIADHRMPLMSGAELFTEHTATAVYPVLDRQASVPRLVRLWGIVVSGNLLGALASAVLLRNRFSRRV